ncbi:hypothetical protein AB0N07_38820 [Streptomyces sp. NPDC051172]|uniref:hypothetical protein n=1 Tax=Streptomyces sp. NPDC051172 TaxID=3155796 RepID=UPI003449AC62
MTLTTAWIRPLAEAPAGAKEVHGSRSRTRQDLFTECVLIVSACAWTAFIRNAVK